jgi:hypothetical protein
MQKIKLIAVDLDGTLFDSHGQISSRCIDAIKRAGECGIYVVISTGRPLVGVPFEKIEGSGIRYAITTNGASIYDIITKQCLYEDAMDEEMFSPIVSQLSQYDLHMDAFIGGKAYGTERGLKNSDRLDVPPSLKDYIINTRTHLKDMPGFIRENHLSVQKMTLNFYPDGKGGYTDRDKAQNLLVSNPGVDFVCGGYHNIEITKAGVNKGIGLHKLAEILGIDPHETMAIGDTENDLAIIKAAGVGVAMGNATDDVKAEAAIVTSSNDEDGVALAIEKVLAKAQ